MHHDRPPGAPSGYVCPRCGGALWERLGGDGAPEYACRIGQALTAEQLWIEHCAARNGALMVAARAVAENAAVARAMAEQARAIGRRDALATRLDEEAESEERYLGQLREMLDGLGDAGPDAKPGQ